MHKGWHSRGYLPHFDAPGLVQAVTFRLADSLPAEAVERLLGARPSSAAVFLKEKEAQGAGEDARAPSRVQALETLLDSGHGACVLRDARCAEVVENALLYFDGTRYRLLGWVVMPNHVHVVVEVLRDWGLPTVVHGWKSFTARHINAILLRRGRLWQPDYFDRYIRDEAHLGRAIDYAEANPVKAGLVARAEAWRWSSAAERARSERGLLERGRPRPPLV